MRAILLRSVRWVFASSLALSAGVALGAVSCMQGCARSASTTAHTEGDADWNDGGVNWRAYEAGLAEARAAGKPVVLIFYTDWCPHCHNYSRVFHDPEVVRLARSFVMIRVERDAHRDISARYALDGEYIPRTYFLSPDGVLLPGLDSGREQYRYYLDEQDPSELTSRMEEALETVGG